MKNLHQKQKALLEILKTKIDDPLTMAQLMVELNVSSTSVVHHHIRQLERKGYLKRNPANAKDYQILSDPEKPIVYINLYGLAQCGPSGSILDGNPVDRIPIASQILKFPSCEAFMIKARGDSMVPKINAGDLVIAQKTVNANNGDIIICVYDGNALIKVFQKDDNFVVLQSINSNKYGPIVVNSNLIRIEGIVKNIIKYS